MNRELPSAHTSEQVSQIGQRVANWLNTGVTRRQFPSKAAEGIVGVHTSIKFLSGAIKGLGSALVKRGLAAGMIEGTTLSSTSESSFTKEESRQLQEIREYRKKLGLFGLPESLKWALTYRKEGWDQPNDFKNELPEHLKSYGMWAEEVLEATGGAQATKLVYGIHIDPLLPHAFHLNSATRYIDLDIATRSFYDLTTHGRTEHGWFGIQEYTGLILHEGAGHGFDPDLAPQIYPTKELIRAFHGKTRAEARAFEIAGQFFNHPDDLTRQYIETGLGAMVGQMYKPVLGSIEQPFGGLEKNLGSENDVTKVRRILIEVAQQFGVNAEDDLMWTPWRFHFTKKYCREVGQKILQEMRAGNIIIINALNSWYRKNSATPLYEIFAEMVRISITQPDLINYDQEIITGIEEVLSTVQGKPVKLEELRAKLATPSQEVKDRYLKEQELIKAQGGDIESLRAKQEIEEIKLKEKTFQQFAVEGTLPMEVSTLPENQQKTLQDYAEACTRVTQVFPGILSLLYPGDMQQLFDPDMDVWETVKVEYSMDPSFIREILEKISVGDASIDFDKVNDNTKTLKGFIATLAYAKESDRYSLSERKAAARVKEFEAELKVESAMKIFIQNGAVPNELVQNKLVYPRIKMALARYSQAWSTFLSRHQNEIAEGDLNSFLERHDLSGTVDLDRMKKIFGDLYYENPWGGAKTIHYDDLIWLDVSSNRIQALVLLKI